MSTQLVGTFLKNTKVDAVGPGEAPSQLRFVRTKENLEEAYLYLAVSGAHGIPVKNDLNDDLAHFGYSELVEWLVRVAGNSTPNEHASVTRHDLFKDKTVQDVLKFLANHPCEPVAVLQNTASLWDVCKLLVEKHAHRVFILEANVLVNVVSPSMIANFLLKHESELEPHQLKESLETLGLARHRAIFSVNESSTLFDAFKYLVGEKITGCAVMRGDKIVGSISNSDVRLVFGEGGGKLLAKTCGEVIAMERKDHHAPATVVTITHDNTLSGLLKRFCEKHVSRVWLTEHGGKPCSTITYTDLIRVIVSEGFVDPTLLWGN